MARRHPNRAAPDFASRIHAVRVGEFILPHDVVREANDPDRVLMNFLLSTYVAAAELRKWDRIALECELGEPRKPRKV